MMLTGLYAGILALVFVALSLNTVRGRVKSKTLFGDGGNPDLGRVVRIHGNFAEYVPLTLLLMTLYEMQAGVPQVTHAAGIALVIARLLHVWGLGADKMPGRVAGTALTATTILVLGVLLIIKGIATVSA